MHRMVLRVILVSLLFMSSTTFAAEPPVTITGLEQSRIDWNLPAGGLPSARGVANIPVFRANREAPSPGDSKGYTYNHHVDMGCWKGRLYVAWDSCEKDEDVWPSREVYSTSSDGYHWSAPVELF